MLQPSLSLGMAELVHRTAHVLLALCVLLGTSLHSAPANVVFQIGEFDGSSAEFSPIFDPVTGQRRIDYADAAWDPVFVVGRDDPARKWFSFQPGNSSGGAGHREHPFAIEFEWDPVPNTSATLEIALLAYSTRLPSVRIEINGRSGEFFQTPALDLRAGDPAVFFLPHYSTSSIHCALPGDAFGPGRNRLVLTALDHPSTRDDVRPSGFPWPGNSGLVYDAIRLRRNAAGPTGPVTIRVEPTIYFQKRGAQLLERIDVIASAPHSLTGSSGKLSMPGASFDFSFMGKGDFGEQKADIWVPAFEGTVPAATTLSYQVQTMKFDHQLKAARRWTLLLVPHEHLDVGYTDYESKVSELQSRTIDRAMEMANKHRGFVFTLDGYWIAEKFLVGRDRASRDRFKRAVRAGTIQIPAVYGSGFTGFAGLENLIRGLYPSARFLETLGRKPEFALITDVPSYSWSLASVLAAADISRLVAASDAYRAPFLLRNRFHTTSPHRWEGPDGAQVLTWYSRHYHQMASLFGMPPQFAQAMESLPRFLQAYDHDEYPGSTVLLYGSQVENTELHPAQATFAAEWNNRFAYPKMQYAGFPEALKRIQAEGAPLPLHRGDGGPYWEDGLGANARITALARRNMDRILSAEKLSSAASRLNRGFKPDRESLESAWRNLLLTDEHTWHADQSVREPDSHQSVRQGEVKDSRAIRADQEIDHLTGRAMSALAETIDASPGDWIAFNPLSWRRSGLVEIDLPKGRGLADAISGERLGGEVVFEGNGFHRVRLLVPEIGPMGYRVFKAVAGRGFDRGRDLDPSERVENQHYRLSVDPDRGGVVSLFDKALGREWIDPGSTNRFGGHLHVTGGDQLPNRLVQFSDVSPLPELTVHRPGSVRLQRAWKTPLGVHVRISGTNRHTPRVETEFILHDRSRRIELIHRIRKDRVLSKEGVYFAHPFAMNEPVFRHATQNGFVNPAQDMLPGAGLEWFIHQGWMSISDRGGTVMLAPRDAPLFTLGDIARGAWPSEFGRRKASIFSYVMNNYTPEGYLAGQGGEFEFSFSFTTAGEFDPVSAHRFAAETKSPIEINEVTRNDRADNRPRHGPPSGEWIQIDSDKVVLTTWKTWEKGKGTILRFLEIAGGSQQVRVTSPLWKIRSAFRCNALETRQGRIPSTENSFEFAIQPFGIATILLNEL